jgi:Ca2+-transporting ATPase
MSIIQGLVITLGLLFVYQYSVQIGSSEAVTRTTVFLTLIVSNIFLTLTNRSLYYSVFTTIRYKNNLVPMIIGVTILMTSLILFVPIFTRFFLFEKVSLVQLGMSILVGFTSVLWIEIYKLFKRKKANNLKQS